MYIRTTSSRHQQKGKKKRFTRPNNGSTKGIVNRPSCQLNIRIALLHSSPMPLLVFRNLFPGAGPWTTQDAPVLYGRPASLGMGPGALSPRQLLSFIPPRLFKRSGSLTVLVKMSVKACRVNSICTPLHYIAGDTIVTTATVPAESLYSANKLCDWYSEDSSDVQSAWLLT